MGEVCQQVDGKWHTGSEIQEVFLFPAIKSLVVDLNRAIVVGANDAVRLHLTDLLQKSSGHPGPHIPHSAPAVWATVPA